MIRRLTNPDNPKKSGEVFYCRAFKVCRLQKYFNYRRVRLSMATFGAVRKLSRGSGRIDSVGINVLFAKQAMQYCSLYSINCQNGNLNVSPPKTFIFDAFFRLSQSNLDRVRMGSCQVRISETVLYF